MRRENVALSPFVSFPEAQGHGDRLGLVDGGLAVVIGQGGRFFLKKGAK